MTNHEHHGRKLEAFTIQTVSNLPFVAPNIWVLVNCPRLLEYLEKYLYKLPSVNHNFKATFIQVLIA